MTTELTISTASLATTARDHTKNDLANRLQPNDRVTSRGVEEESHTGRQAKRNRWENTPGIRVTLQSLEQDPVLQAYESLHYSGRRVVKNEQPTSISASPEESAVATNGSSRKVNRLALETLIKQMSGELQNPDRGALLNERV